MRIKELREERSLTQQEVAEAIGGTQSNLAKWERGKIQPAAEAIVKLADFFGVSTDYLLGRTDDLGNIQSSRPAHVSDEDREIISLFHALTPAYQAAALSTLRAWAGVPAAAGTSKKKA